MIKSLQGLRALGMNGIFLFHSGLLLKGTFPVTFFFMLSGFVLYYSYSNRIKSINFSESINWIVSRMKKLYPIHIITFMMSIFIRWEWISEFEITDIINKALLNIFLLQSLSRKHIFTFNGLSWFLSTTFILYILAIPLMLLIKKIKFKKLHNLILLILVLQNIVIFINNSQKYELSLYTSPFFRVFDFAIGMIIAKKFIDEYKDDAKYKYYSFYEFGILILFSIMYIITLVSSAKLEYALSYYSPIFVLGIYIFAHEKGFISKLLCNEVLQKIAKFSFEFYMVHELILILFRNVFENLTYHWLIKNIIISIPSLIISLLLAIVLNKFITNKEIFKLIASKDKESLEVV